MKLINDPLMFRKEFRSKLRKVGLALFLFMICCIMLCRAQTSSKRISIHIPGQSLETAVKMIEAKTGVSVYAKGQSNWTTTNNLGFFSITFPDDNVALRVSYLDYEGIEFQCFYYSAAKNLIFAALNTGMAKNIPSC